MTSEAIIQVNNGLPVFNGESWEDHISAWIQTAGDIGEKQWYLGAIAQSVERTYRSKGMRKFAGEVMMPASTVYDYARVYKVFQVSERSEILSWAHHLIATRAADPQEALRVAEDEGLSVRALKEWVDKQPKVETKLELPESCRVVSDLQDLIDEGELFSTLYVDPPWPYQNQGTRAATDNHYRTMTVDDIAALPVAQLVDTNAHLHLWTTNAFLFEARRLIEAWGFEYKSVFVWCKPQMGIGNYWRVSHEFLLLGVRGSMTFRDKSQMSWKEIDRGEHSAKPYEMRQKIELVSPGPYLELFGREAWPGWTVFGNQVRGLGEPPQMQAISGPLFNQEQVV